MEIGVTMFPTHTSIGVVELGRAAEDLGFESLWFPEHTNIPVSRATPYPAGGELPEEYRQILDPFTALAAVAAVTERIGLGTGICLVPQRDPIVTAKEVATVDLLSGGRFLFGIGAGWNHEEMRQHGTDPATRFALMRERVLAMKALWTEDEAAFEGEYVRVERTWQWPKPVQDPHPPVLVGGTGPGVLDRVLDYGDGWIPTGWRDTEGMTRRIEELRARAADAGRDHVPVTVFGAPPKPEALEELVAAGVDRAVLWLPPVPADEALPRLRRHSEHVGRF